MGPLLPWCGGTARPRDTRPQAARTSQVHVFELGPKKFEMNEFMYTANISAVKITVFRCVPFPAVLALYFLH